MRIRTRIFLGSLSLLLAISSEPGVGAAQNRASNPTTQTGETATQLPDGRWLIVGRADGEARIVDASSGVLLRLPGPRTARRWHSATLLPDGSVLILGGVNDRGQTIAEPEAFDPATAEFTPIRSNVVTPRAHHTATLLTDGRVLLVGGDVEAGGVIAEVWDSSSSNTYPVAPPAMQRRGHRAELLPDGRVLIDGGVGERGRPAGAPEIFQPGADAFITGDVASPSQGPALAGASPIDGAVNVSVDARIALRFGEPIEVRSVARAVVSVDSSGREIPSMVVAAEEGRLVFITPRAPLDPGASVVVSIDGLLSASGLPVDPARITFTVASADGPIAAPRPRDPDLWVPRNAKWRSEPGGSEWKRLAPLQASPGVTALAGQALRLDGRPLPDVTLKIEGHSVRSDRTGRFLLPLGNLSGGWHELTIEGKTANRAAQRFGRFEYGLSIVKGRTNILPFTIWMPVLDTANAVRIESPTRAETMITSPYIPGLELHLPAGTTITDEDGKAVREISITPIPVDRPPFPLPNGVQVPIYFTIQPGGAYIHPPGGSGYQRGAWLVYPNYSSQPVGERLPFWLYDPEENGWHVYGFGRVNPDGRQVTPERGTYLYEFTGAMIGVERDPPADPPGDGEDDGDPVDLATGLFIKDDVDLYLPDVIPLVLKRTYRNNDDGVRAFGVGTQHPYDMWFDNQVAFQEADLILPDATRIHYVRTSPGVGLGDAVFEHTTTPTAFYGSRVAYNGNGWDLTMKDGTVFVFALEAPLQSIRDRFGNTVTITRTGGVLGNIARITSPNGRYIEFTYDTSNRITQATDSADRTVTYTYDTAGTLSTVTDVKGGVTEYTYDAAHRLLTAENARNIVYLENEYDTAGRVVRQTQADDGEYEFGYTLNGSGQITQTDITNPRGFVRRVVFNTARYPTSDTRALGQAVEQVTVKARLSGSQMLDTVTDELGRVTAFQYDSNGNVTSIERLFGTTDVVTRSFAFDTMYNELTSYTDPLNHTMSMGYSAGRPQSITTPLSNQWTFGTNAAGQIVSITNPLSKTSTVIYETGDIAAVTTPMGNTTLKFVDAAGRFIQVQDPRGRVTRYEYDARDQVTKIADPLGGELNLTYDANDNLLTLTDQRGKTWTWTYDDMDRVATKTDPLSRQESFTYDLNGNVATSTDRNGQVTTYSYDPLDRPTFTGFGTTGNPAIYESTITTTYDGGNRATQVVDSAAGTITRTYDLLDRLTQEVTPEGTINYTYDAADRRTSMTVAGQTAVSYTYDNVDRLTAITQGTSSVSIAYDAAGRRTSLTLPNGVTVESAYDDDSQLAGLTYKLAGTTIGQLAYTYDAAGLRTEMAGTYARSNLPMALSSATYDDANQLATWGGSTISYDANGNLTSDGSRSYTWNARNELTALTGSPSASFAYDAFGRRRAKTVASTTTQFLYDGATPVQELAGGVPFSNLLTGLGTDEYYRRADASTTRHYLTDAFGTVIALSDSGGTVQTEYTYEPFGNFTATGSTTGNTFTFTGREADGTDLLFHRARYYDPRLQRFLSEDPIASLGDPIGAMAGPNLYSYARQNPLTFVDRDGRFPIAAAGAVAIAVTAYIAFCQKRAMDQAEKFFELFDKKKHCFASCEFNRCMGSGAPAGTLIGGFLYEILGTWRGWDSVQDMLANAWGVGSSYNIFASCRSMCEVCPIK
jgi:RHS repeat-associated protein